MKYDITLLSIQNFVLSEDIFKWPDKKADIITTQKHVQKLCWAGPEGGNVPQSCHCIEAFVAQLW